MIKNKKAIVMEEIIFYSLNAVFFIILLVFIASSLNGKAVLEQKYAKTIALMIDEAKPETTIFVDMEEALDKSSIPKEEAVKINEQDKEVIVKLSSGRGYVFNYFSDFSIEKTFQGNDLVLKIGEKGATVFPDLIFFAASGDIKPIEGKPDINQRKTELGIPDKLCYWESMKVLYEEKCPSLSETEIKEIFDKKKVYREKNTPDWAVLNYDGDFCVPVIFDYNKWDEAMKNRPSDAEGFWNGKEIFINPYKDFTKERISIILIHEGLHSVQSKLEGQQSYVMPDGLKFSGSVFGQADPVKVLLDQRRADDFLEESLSEEEEPCKSIELIRKELHEIIYAKIEKLNSEIKKLPEGEEKTNKLSEVGKLYDFDDDYSFALQGICLVPVNLLTTLYYELYNQRIDKLLADAENYPEIKIKLVPHLEGVRKIYFEARVKAITTQSKGYIGMRVELDPRLSEVQRWWLDSHNCEIIYTQEKAKEALDSFLADKNIPAQYMQTQIELKGFLDVYKGTEYEQAAYDSLITRLPGIAQADITIEGGSAYA